MNSPENTWFYYLRCAGGFGHPIRAAQTLWMRWRIKREVRKTLDQIFERALNQSTFMRFEGESDDHFRKRFELLLGGAGDLATGHQLDSVVHQRLTKGD